MQFLTRIREARRRRQAIRDLRAMPSELLLDIGIEPDQIETVASGVGRVQKRRGPASLEAPSLSRGPWPYVWSR